MLQIEWKSSHYHSDGRRRSRPKDSTVHGWLVKWRATFSGNERLRKEGIREMRKAKDARLEQKRKRKAARLADSEGGVPTSFFCLGPILLGKEQAPQAPKGSSRGAQVVSRRQTEKSKEDSRSAQVSSKHPNHRTTRHPTSQTRSPRGTPVNSRRSSHNRQATLDRTPHSSRKASYDSRKDNLRAAKK